MSLSLPRLSSVSSSFSLPFAPAVAMNPFCIPWISNIFKFSWVFFPAFTCRIAYWSTRSQSIRCGQDTSIKSKTSFLMAESSRAGECVPFQHSENMWYFIVHTVVILHSAYTMNTWDGTLVYCPFTSTWCWKRNDFARATMDSMEDYNLRLQTRWQHVIVQVITQRWSGPEVQRFFERWMKVHGV